MTDRRILKAINNWQDYYFGEKDITVDHLWETCLVWELYTSSNRLFKQVTPILSASTIDAAVSDVAARTQLHIQRLWSWTESNSLKIKIKKVWTPWNLNVAVMSGTQVNVSSTEAYRYWSSTIATWTISASNVTTTYSEQTVTLNNNFWWTKWQKLNVVLYATVDASNYYVIACDWWQVSEWFSYVYVNWSTRTRQIMCPYCVSNWFASSMTSKFVDAQKYTILNSTNNFHNNDYVYNTTLTTWTMWYISIYHWYAWEAYNLKLYCNWVLLDTQSVPQKSWNFWYRTTYFSWLVYKWALIQIKVENWWSASQCYEPKVYLESALKCYWPTLIVNEVKWIWQSVSWVTFWNSYDETFTWWVMVTTADNAWTWSITLWNAVWYLVVRFNWQFYKIPYYNYN